MIGHFLLQIYYIVIDINQLHQKLNHIENVSDFLKKSWIPACAGMTEGVPQPLN